MLTKCCIVGSRISVLEYNIARLLKGKSALEAVQADLKSQLVAKDLIISDMKDGEPEKLSLGNQSKPNKT